jgi:long-chain fatty acid transport protein
MMSRRKTPPTRALRSLLLFGTASPLLLIAASPAQASGFYLQEQSVRGWGRANSGEAADQGPASLWWNPAAIGWAEEGEEGRATASFGATALVPTGRLADDGTQIDRPGAPPVAVGGPGLERNPAQKGLLPGTAVALRLGKRLAMGVAVTSPFSFTTDYDPSGWQRYSAIRTRLLTLDVQPSIAFAPTDWLSLGAGLNIEYGDAFLSNALPNLAAGSPDGRLTLAGKGTDLGWSAGLQLRPARRLTIGLAYKSAVEHDLAGALAISGLAGPLAARNAKSDVVATFSTPWQLILAARFALTDRTTLNLQAVRFGWSRFDQIGLSGQVTGAIPEGYKNSASYAFGLDHRLSRRLTLRAGLQLDGTPTRDDRRDPRVPDADRVDYNAGLSFALSGRFTLDAAAGLTDFEDAPITRDERFYAGTAAETLVLGDGQARGQRAIVISAGGRLRF